MTTTQYYYYYSDPLSALWMAKNFNMKFYDGRDPNHGNIIFDMPDLIFYYQNGCGGLEGWDSTYEGQFHIHPDSTHLLTPQFGDVVDSDEDYGTRHIGFPSILNYLYQTPPPIVQRNKVSFHWPSHTKNIICDQRDYVYIKSIVVNGLEYSDFRFVRRSLERIVYDSYATDPTPTIEIISAPFGRIPWGLPVAKFTKEQWELLNEVGAKYGVKCTDLIFS